jgi:hypothetical protein
MTDDQTITVGETAASELYTSRSRSCSRAEERIKEERGTLTNYENLTVVVTR